MIEAITCLGKMQTDDQEADPGNSLKLSLDFRVHEKVLIVRIHQVTGVAPKTKGNSFLVAEVTLNQGGYHRSLCVNVPKSTSDDQTKTVVFVGMTAFNLASQSLALRLSTKGSLRRKKQTLYQASVDLTDVSLCGDANWLSLKQIPQERSCLTLCMCYNHLKEKLMVTIVKATSLKKSIVRNDSYTEVKLVRGCGGSTVTETVRTRPSSGGQNPVYKQAFLMNFPLRGPLSTTHAEIRFTVRRRSLMGAGEVLGRVSLSSNMALRWKRSQILTNTLDEVFRYPGKVITQRHPLITRQTK